MGMHDLRVGFRSSLKTPLITAAALISLMVGISSNTVIFSVLNALVLQPLPFPEPQRIVVLWQNRLQNPSDVDQTAPANFVDWKNESRCFAHLAAFQGDKYDLTQAGRPEEVEGAQVTPGFFETLGALTRIGRLFTPEDAATKLSRVALISNGLWHRRFGSDPNIIGKEIRLNGVPYTIIGVMRSGWYMGWDTDVWTPLGWSNSDLKRDDHFLSVIGRLRLGVTVEQARSEMSGIARRLTEKFPNEDSGYGVLIKPITDVLPTQKDRRAASILMAAVACVLLITCANIMSLQLAKAHSRSIETATRAALGASRGALIRQSLVESLMLALLGGAAAIALSSVLIRLLSDTVSLRDYWNPLRLNLSVLLFTFGISAVSGLLFGCLPAICGSCADLQEFLRQGGRSGTGGRRFRLFGRILVGGEVMFAILLLTIGGNMIFGFIKARNENPGFRTVGLTTMSISLPAGKYGKNQFSQKEIATQTLDRISERVATIPGVEGVTYATLLPRNESDPRSRFLKPEERSALGGEAPIASWRAVAANYFDVMGIRITNGRGFTAHDSFDSAMVVVVSRAFARQYYPGQNAVGKLIYFFDAPRQIVGVVGDVLLNRSLVPPPCIYLPHAQSPRLSVSYLIRTLSPSSWLAASLPEKVSEIDPDQPVSNIMTYDKYADFQFAGRRLTAALLLGFCFMAVVMVAVGLYGLVSYLASLRTKEFGIRLAVGANRFDLFTSVMTEALAVTASGVVAGVALLIINRSSLSGLLGDLQQNSWNVPAAIIMLLLVITGLAALWPAVRVTFIQPSSALRDS